MKKKFLAVLACMLAVPMVMEVVPETLRIPARLLLLMRLPLQRKLPAQAVKPLKLRLG